MGVRAWIAESGTQESLMFSDDDAIESVGRLVQQECFVRSNSFADLKNRLSNDRFFQRLDSYDKEQIILEGVLNGLYFDEGESFDDLRKLGHTTSDALEISRREYDRFEGLNKKLELDSYIGVLERGDVVRDGDLEKLSKLVDSFIPDVSIFLTETKKEAREMWKFRQDEIKMEKIEEEKAEEVRKIQEDNLQAFYYASKSRATGILFNTKRKAEKRLDDSEYEAAGETLRIIEEDLRDRCGLTPSLLFFQL
jgi:hypothetical protein